MKKNDPLLRRIFALVKSPGVGMAIIDGTNLIQRLRLGQMRAVAEILERNCSLQQEGRGPALDEPLYLALQLGELIACYNQYGKCEYAGDCWVTRRAFCKLREEKRENI